MADQQNDPQKKVSLEELLRVKRSERPDQAFWGQFDRELHQRMLQTLVKKDPWYVQVMRGLRGRIAQTATVSGLAALLLLTVGRSVIFSPAGSAQMAEISQESSDFGIEVASSPEVQKVDGISNLSSESIAPNVMAAIESSSRDYQMMAIEGKSAASDAGLKRDFALDSLHVASYDSTAYSGDVASSSLSFVNTGVASLVY